MPKSVVVVCTGNICRSPMGEVVLRDRLEAAGVDAVVSSAGVSDEERGNPVDRRAAAALRERGYEVLRREARRVEAADLDADLVLAMTRAHRDALLRLGADPERTRLWTSFVPDAVDEDVDDPWYGGREDFEACLDTVEAGAPGVVAALRD